MQGQNLGDMQTGVDLSRQLSSKAVPAETFGTSLSENTGGGDEYCINQARNSDEILDVEKAQKNLPSITNGNESMYEASVETLYDNSTVEPSSTWGDFEAFSEVKLKNLSNNQESLGKLSEKQIYTNGVDLNHSCTTTSLTQFFSQAARHNRREASINVKAVSSAEDVFKLSFPDIPVPQFLEKISNLEQILHTKTDSSEIPEHTEQQLCTDSADLWRTLTRCSNLSSLKCAWNKSLYQENLLAVFGIDVHQKALPEGEDILEETNIKENEDSSVDKCNISMCKALIQTKLSVSPDARQSHLFTYNLFLKKTPSTGNMQCITVPQKKRIFTTQSLRMKMFSSNVC